MKIVHLVISDGTFGGFETFVKITGNILTNQHLIDNILQKLTDVLNHNKLEDAQILLQNKHFHIHGLDFETITQMDDIVYVCHHD